MRASVALVLFTGLASLVGGCSGPEDPLTHGSVKLQFLVAENEDSSPYVGTVQVRVTLDYLDCLVQFYDRETTWRQEGPDGDPVFGSRDLGGEGWKDRLCDGSLGTDGPGVECTVLEIDQELDVSKHLSVLYEVTGDIENRELHFGPLPTRKLAECEGGGAPLVRVSSSADIVGQTGEGVRIWDTKTFDPDQAATDQGLAIKVKAGLQ